MDKECKFCGERPLLRVSYFISTNQKWSMSLKEIEGNFILAIEKTGSDKMYGKRIRYCPFCGRKLDEKGDADNETK